MSYRPTSEAIAAAAKWWADQLRTRTKQDNGVVDGHLAMAIAHARAANPPVDPVRADLFEAELEQQLSDMPVAPGRNWVLACDYSPMSNALCDAAEKAGIRCTCPPFPMKTVMWIEQDAVRMRHGYGASVHTIYEGTTTTAGE